jgi:hypothetical protein
MELVPMLLRLLLCVAVTLTTPRVAAAQSNIISCTGAFAADSSHARLVATFGRRNVVYKVIDAGEGFTSPASIIFPDDESRRIEYFFGTTRNYDGIPTGFRYIRLLLRSILTGSFKIKFDSECRLQTSNC